MSYPPISALVLTNGNTIRAGSEPGYGSPVTYITAIVDNKPWWCDSQTAFLVENDEGVKAIIPYAHVVLIEFQKEEGENAEGN